MTPPVGIGQRALLVRTGDGNLLWDPPGYLDDDAIEKVRAAGGLRAVTASHPHFYGAMAEWAHAFGAGALLSGDTVFVTPGEDRLSFIWSAPNRLPLPELLIRGILDALRPFAFDRIYGGWAPTIRTGARRLLEASAERYIQFLRGEAPD